MTKEEIAIFLKVQPKLKTTHEEMSILSKKNPNDAINKFKLKLVNSMIAEANSILQSTYKPFDDFTLFSEDDVPSNSDVVFILSPYLRSLEKLRRDNIDYEMGTCYWKVNGSLDRSLKADSPAIR
jgi:hypothetical protein